MESPGARTLTIPVGRDEASLRLDRLLVLHLPDLSRTRLQKLVEDGDVKVDGRTRKPGYKLRAGEIITVTVLPLKIEPLEAEAIPIEIVYEDSDLLVVNKTAG